MEQLFVQALTHVPGATRGCWRSLCYYWEWGFWLGVAAAILGAFLLYFARRSGGPYT